MKAATVALGLNGNGPHLGDMIRLLFLTAVIAASAQPAMAQVAPPPPQPGYDSWPDAVDPTRYQIDQHRYEIDRLRAQADQRETFARQLELETRLNRQRVEAARPPEPIQPPSFRTLRSTGEERALRRSASERRAATASDVGQIDAWLDRPHD